MQNILVHPADAGGCYWYRLHNPYKLLQDHKLVNVRESNVTLSGADLLQFKPYRVFTQRQTEVTQVQYITNYKILLPSTPVVMDLDDLIWNVPPTNGYKLSGEQRKAISTNLKQCDIIIASTEPLKQQITSRIRRNDVRVLHNMVSREYYCEPKRRDINTKLRVGWAGSSTHSGDLRHLYHIIKETSDVIQWVFLGWAPPQLKPIVEFHEGVPVSGYMAALQRMNLDLTVIPLEPHIFNECKSHLKLLEFGAIGVPAITSKIAPYLENPGFLIESSKPQKEHKLWKAALLELVNNEDLRFQQAVDTYKWALKYQLETRDCLAQVINAWMI